MQKVRKRGVLVGLGIPVVIAALFGLAQLGGGGSSDGTSDSTGPANLATPCPKTDGSEKRVTTFAEAPPMCIDPGKKYVAVFDTTEGTIEVALDTDKTPNTVNNFVVLSRYKYYDTSYIFRTDPSLDIIQGGGTTNTDTPGYSIPDEGSGFAYSAGDLVMARSAAENSGGGQFFFVTGPKASVLDSQGTYVTFGKITKGLDVAQAILALNEGAGDLGGAPSRPVQVKTVTIVES